MNENEQIVAEVRARQSAEADKARGEIKRRLAERGVQAGQLDAEYEAVLAKAREGRRGCTIRSRCYDWHCQLYGCMASD